MKEERNACGVVHTVQYLKGFNHLFTGMSVKGKRNQKSNSYHLTQRSHGNDISLPVPILSRPRHFSARIQMIQTALGCQPFLRADAAQIPPCIAILSLLPAGLSITDGIVKKQI